MPDPDFYRKGVVACLKAGHSAMRAAESEIAQIHRKLEAARENLELRRGEFAKRSRTPSWIPGGYVAKLWSAVGTVSWNRGLVATEALLRSDEAVLASNRTRLREREMARARLETALKGLNRSRRETLTYKVIPADIEGLAKRPIAELYFVLRRRKRDIGRLTAIAHKLAGAGHAWHEHELKSERLLAERADRTKPSPSRGSHPAPLGITHAIEPIYLPIPQDLGWDAMSLGAEHDPKVRRGSGYFIPKGAELAPFERYLPLAYRKQAPVLSFPPVRHRASSQNLWSFFDKETWNHIRHINYGRTGRRCVLCGRQSGSLLKIFDGAENRVGSVDCHEIWEWFVPDPSISIGIQKLKSIKIVCWECHATFHQGFAVSQAKTKGMDAEVKRFLLHRQHFLTRLPPAEIRREMEAEKLRLRAHSDIKLWVVDLTNLGRQDYMQHVKPVFKTANSPGVKASHIAGLSFIDDDGQKWPKVSARQIHSTMADLYRNVSVRDFMASREP